MSTELFLVAFEYGHGAVYSFVAAHTIDDVLAAGPELVYHRTPPHCLTDDDLAGLRARAIDLIELGHGSLVEEILLSKLGAETL